MDGERCAWQEDVEQALRLCIKALVEVEIHTKAWRCFSFRGNFVEEFAVNYHIMRLLNGGMLRGGGSSFS